MALPQIEEVTERYLEIREVKTGKLIQVVEVFSHKNKRVGEGREKYLIRSGAIVAGILGQLSTWLLTKFWCC